MPQAARRILGHLDRLAASGRSHVLCVSHCDMIRGAIASYTGMGFDRMLEFDIAPGSLSSLVVDGRTARVVSVNRVPR
jgi:broad specificity phosphatase PhoE